MQAAMDYSPAVCFRLITEVGEILDHHCSLCTFFHDDESQCEHVEGEAPNTSRPKSAFSDSSWYTARTSHSTSSLLSDSSGSSGSSGSSTSTIKARVSAQPLRRKPSLRRKTSPTKVSLRELRAQQSRQSLLRAKQSDERLQRVYESQISAYLDGPLGNVDGVTQ